MYVRSSTYAGTCNQYTQKVVWKTMIQVESCLIHPCVACAVDWYYAADAMRGQEKSSKTIKFEKAMTDPRGAQMRSYVCSSNLKERKRSAPTKQYSSIIWEGGYAEPVVLLLSSFIELGRGWLGWIWLISTASLTLQPISSTCLFLWGTLRTENTNASNEKKDFISEGRRLSIFLIRL